MRVLLGLLVVVAACRKEAPPEKAGLTPAVVATVGEAIISREQFEAELAQRSRTAPGRYQSAAERDALLDELIQFEVLFARATAAGYHERADLQERFRRMVVARYEQDHAPKSSDDWHASAAEIEAYYQQHRDQFSEPARVRPAILFLKLSAKATPEKKQDALARAETIRNEALKLAEGSFGDLARQHSENAATRYRGGDCGWLLHGQPVYEWPSNVVEAMFTLAPGETSPVLATAEGLYLVKVIERAEAAAKPLASVRDHIAWKISTERSRHEQQQFFEQQRSGLRIVVNRPVLDSISTPATNPALTEGAPPALPGR